MVHCGELWLVIAYIVAGLPHIVLQRFPCCIHTCFFPSHCITEICDHKLLQMVYLLYRTLHERSEHALNMQIKPCKMIPQPASIIDVALFKKLVDMLPCMMSGYRCDHRDLRESRNSWIKCSFPSSSIYRGSDNLWPCSQKIYYKMKKPFDHASNRLSP